MKLSDFNIYDIGNKVGLVGAVFGDEDNTYLMLFPDQSAGELKIVELDLDDWKKVIRQTDLLETEVLAFTEEGKLAKTILRKSQRLVDQRINWRVFKRDGYRCRYCGRDDVPMTVDHLVLWEEGGPTIETNLVSACKRCNKTRSNTQYAEWLRHPYYVRVSKNLPDGGWEANEALVATLPGIPRNRERKTRK